ncbi:MAG: hypothetical protein ABSB30_05615 [Terracidiphilus sp.]|jgi:hypothetical protein
MSEDEKSSLVDAALAHVDPDRRKFLGILLAGVAAAPLLNSASLAAEDKPADHKGEVFPKNATTAKGSPAIKDGSANTIKLNNQSDKTIKFWDKTSGGSNAQIKGENPQLKFDGKPPKSESTAIKNGNSNTIKGANQDLHKNATPALKYESTPIKGENAAIKGANTANKGETKPVQH